MPTVFMLILFGVSLNAGAQLLLKAGMTRIGHFEFSFNNLVPIGMKVLGNPPILAGLCAYVLSVGIWMMVLSRVQVSFAYPLLSIGYIINAIAAYYLFGEDLSMTQIVGIFVIISGVYLVSQGAAT